MSVLKTKINRVGIGLLMAISLSAPIIQAQEFNFKFTYKGETWSHPVSADKWTLAFEKASQDCLNYFTKSGGTKKVSVDERTADALLNTCANPR